MRHDMSKVLVERPRRRGYYSGFRKGRHYETIASSIRNAVDAYFYDPDEAESPPSMESMRPKGRGVDRKELNENLGPLWGFLQSRVGRLWNDVYSEIREHLGPDSAVQMHVVQHVKQGVVTDTVIVDGKVGYYGKYGRGFLSLEGTSNYKLFYVHPLTGILCVTPVKRQKYPRKDRPESVIQISEKIQYRYIDNVWYWVRLDRIPKALGIPSRYYYSLNPLEFDHVGDILFKDGLRSWQRKYQYGNEFFYAVEKRQCGRRELKQIKRILSE
jgi:hypothetical protein